MDCRSGRERTSTVRRSTICIVPEHFLLTRRSRLQHSSSARLTSQACRQGPCPCRSTWSRRSGSYNPGSFVAVGQDRATSGLRTQQVRLIFGPIALLSQSQNFPGETCAFSLEGLSCQRANLLGERQRVSAADRETFHTDQCA
jgi:hypothetical protein